MGTKTQNHTQATAEMPAARFEKHSVDGPLFSGPHLEPWLCTTEENGLGSPAESGWHTPAQTHFHYLSRATGTFESYDPTNPPAPEDVLSTTTDAGAVVPYIVRREIGAANRGLYELAVLFDPNEPWSPAEPQAGWNGKLWVYSYGGWNQFWSQSSFQDPPPSGDLGFVPPAQTVLRDLGLGRGFMIARTTQMQSRTNSDSVRAAESLVMLKEHITRTYGAIRFTMGSGASGGSILQQVIANQYPGIFQGIIPMSSLHSSWYLPSVLNECKLLDTYFTRTSPDLWSDEADRIAVDGHRNEEVAAFMRRIFGSPWAAGNAPSTGTGLPASSAYDSVHNPSGARGTLQDYQVNYLGRRPRALWTDAEHRAGVGFAHLPWDNRGIQYGLQALLEGRISPEQFVDLNEKVGGVDIDNNVVSERTDADAEGIARMHRTGLVNDYSNMSGVAILDLRNPEHEDPIMTHTQFHTWVSRAALTQAQGHADNHVAWIVPGFATSYAPTQAAFLLMDQWLTAVAQDHSDRPLAEKVVANKPADARDGIRDLEGNDLGDLTAYQTQFPSYGDATMVAACGDLRAYWTPKPQLKPLDRADYPGVTFTDDQWGRLQNTFPDGVADWTKPGIGATATVPWLSYADGPGGTPLDNHQL